MLWENLREEEFNEAIEKSSGVCILPGKARSASARRNRCYPHNRDCKNGSRK